jgi:hypothetical protein
MRKVEIPKAKTVKMTLVEQVGTVGMVKVKMKMAWTQNSQRMMRKIWMRMGTTAQPSVDISIRVKTRRKMGITWEMKQTASWGIQVYRKCKGSGADWHSINIPACDRVIVGLNAPIGSAV